MCWKFSSGVCFLKEGASTVHRIWRLQFCEWGHQYCCASAEGCVYLDTGLVGPGRAALCTMSTLDKGVCTKRRSTYITHHFHLFRHENCMQDPEENQSCSNALSHICYLSTTGGNHFWTIAKNQRIFENTFDQLMRSWYWKALRPGILAFFRDCRQYGS